MLEITEFYKELVGKADVSLCLTDLEPMGYTGLYVPEQRELLLEQELSLFEQKITVVHELTHALQSLSNELVGFPFGEPTEETKKFIQEVYFPTSWMEEFEAFAIEEAWEENQVKIENWLRHQFSILT